MRDERIIDGVDVSGCIFFDRENRDICCCDDTREDVIPFANFCQENPNCYYKQRQRKIEECEEQKARVETLRVENNRLTGKVCDIRNYAGLLQKKLQIATKALKSIQKICKQ